MDNIKFHFSKTVDDYDTVADKVVMKNEELHQQLIDAIPFSKQDSFKILDLGCGTGHGINLICNIFSHAQITGIDFSPKMIEKCQENITSVQNRIQFIEADFNVIDFPEKYDVIISAIAIHNSTHEQKKQLFKKIYENLNQNGIFINADFIEAETPELNEQYRQIYKAYLETHLTGEELQVWLKHAFVDDKPMKLSEQFAVLNQAGFSHQTLLWQFNNEAIYITKK